MRNIVYLRRKALLGLVDLFDGELSLTDCQKLMFLLCRRANEEYYDFFPHKYGAYSQLMNFDRYYLIKKGYLKDVTGYVLAHRSNAFLKLDMFIQQQMIELKNEIGNIRGRDLVRKTYEDYPRYAIRSEIAEETLSAEEYASVRSALICKDEPTVFTIGYEGKTIDRYLDELILNNITVLADVRKNPQSRKHGFSKSQLQGYVNGAGIQYMHLGDLGVPSHLRQNLKDETSYTNLFNTYSQEILPNNQSAIAELKAIIDTNKRVALTCFEADPRQCHRFHLVRYLEQDTAFEIPIRHI